MTNPLTPIKPLLVVASPIAGTKSTPIKDLEAVLVATDLNYDLVIAKDPPAAYQKITAIATSRYGAVAVYGGDGTVIQAVKASYKKDLPVLILPGGTANALAKAAGVPSNLASCLNAYAIGKYSLKYLNVAMLNDSPLILDMHAGLWADSIMTTPREQKKRWGVAAYFISTLKQIKSAPQQHYQLQADNQIIDMIGYACIVGNEGQHRFLGLNLFPWPNAGSLSIAIIRTTKLTQLVGWYIGRLLFHRNAQGVVYLKRANQIIFKHMPKTMLVDDDAKTVKLPLKLEISPKNAAVIVPLAEAGAFFTNLRLQLKYLPYRFYDHLKRTILGAPSRNYCQVTTHLYVGGSYRQEALGHFQDWGITGIVSLQERWPDLPEFNHIKVLHLPTRDHTAPSIEDINKGVAFITQQIAKGGSVYVHCRLGEGRGPTMATAYLMSKGMKLEDAISHIRRYRPFVRPNRLQVRQLSRWYVSRHD